MNRMRQLHGSARSRTFIGHLLGAVLVAAVVAAGHFLALNATTAALALLLAVLYEATAAGLAPAISTSILAVLSFNFFFLPPFGTLTIDDPQNWIALIAFLITAVTASQLSARAQRRAAEAVEQRTQAEQSYAFGRAMLVNENIERTVQGAVADLVRIFDVQSAAFFGIGAFGTETTLDHGNAIEPQFAAVASSGEQSTGPDWLIVPV